MGIYKKLLELQKELTVMPKQATGGSSKNSYKYTSGDYLFSVLRPKMDTLGLLLFQEIIETKSEHVLWKTTYGDKQQTYASATFKFTWVDADTDEKVEHLFHADGFNDWDKAIGSAMTYAERYYILKQFHIPTTELDPDAREEHKPESTKTKEEVIAKVKQTEKRVAEELGIPAPEKATDEQLSLIRTLSVKKGSKLGDICRVYKITKLQDMCWTDAKHCIDILNKKENV